MLVNLKVKPYNGDYVLASRWSDASLNDPWCVGYVYSVRTVNGVEMYMLHESSRWWHKAVVITKEQGEARLRVGKEFDKVEETSNAY